jgi:hypothetical protein
MMCFPFSDFVLRFCAWTILFPHVRSFVFQRIQFFVLMFVSFFFQRVLSSPKQRLTHSELADGAAGRVRFAFLKEEVVDGRL